MNDITDTYSNDEIIFLSFCVKNLKLQIAEYPNYITEETDPKYMPYRRFKLHQFKVQCARWEKSRILSTLRSLEKKGVIEFFNHKRIFNYGLLDHGKLLKEFNHV